MRTYTMTLMTLVALLFLVGCGGSVELFDFDNDGVMDGDDCGPEDPNTHPGATEICDCVDNDCDGVVDEGIPNCDCEDPGDDDDATGDDDTGDDDSGDDDDSSDNDEDGDGWTPQEGDCNDHDPDVHPGADEVCDGVDTNCDGLDDADDADNDGFTPCDGDCDDTQPSLNPYATDLVGDGVDQNCDGIDGTDADGDGHASELSGGDDCDDNDNSIFPGAVEVWYDGIDQQCDGVIDDGDQDGDGYDWDGIGGDDCVDTNPNAYPGAHEDNTDGVDNNCNGITDGFHVTMTWTPGLTWQDIEDNPATVVMTLYVEDLAEDHFLDFYITDVTHPNYSYTNYIYWGTTVDLDFWSSDLHPDGCIGPTATQTYMVYLWNGLCYAWGYDPAVLDPTNFCRWEDPTLY